MTTVFVNSALEQVRDIAVQPSGKSDLSDLIGIIHAANNAHELLNAGQTAFVAKRGDKDIFLVTSGKLRALVTSDRISPDRLVVASVYRDDLEESLPPRDAG